MSTIRASALLEERIAWATALLGLLLAMLVRVDSQDFALDDAWIHLSYAKSLRHGDGLSYNPGDWALGYSSPLWVFLLAVWPIDRDPVFSAQLLGALLHAATTWTGARLALVLAQRQATVDHPVALASITALAGTLIASWPPLLTAAVSGMEVSLTSALVLGALVNLMESRRRSSAVCSALAVWARPEAAVPIVVFATWSRVRAPSATAWRWPIAAIGLSAACWVAWNLAVAGQVLPNAHAIKSTLGSTTSLVYIVDDVLVWEPWVVSLTGVPLLVLGATAGWRAGHREGVGLGLAWLITMLAIAASRELHPGVAFYERRYFLIVSALPCVGIALSLLRLRVAIAAALLAPLVAMLGWQSREWMRSLREWEHDTHALHTVPANYLSEHLPADARVAVEGAGAARHHTPRTMHIIDIVGLNHHAIAHAPSPIDRMCEVILADPTHVLVPDNAVAPLRAAFELTPIHRFDDPAFHQVHPPHPARVHLFATAAVRPAWRDRCARPPQSVSGR